MPSARVRSTDWSAGEWSDLLEGRVDQDKYAHAAHMLENFLILQGGAIRHRPGTRFIAATGGTTRARLMPFVFSEDQAYVLEWSLLRLRFYTNTARIESAPDVPVQLTHTYTTDQLRELKTVQSADILFIAQQAHFPAQLERLERDGSRWRLRDIRFDVLPSREYGLRGTLDGAGVSPGALTGDDIPLFASFSAWLPSDVGRTFEVRGGVNAGAAARIIFWTSPTGVSVTVLAPFSSLDQIQPHEWRLDGSPLTTATPSAKDPVGAHATVTLGASGFRVGNVGHFIHLNGGTFEIVAFTNDAVVDTIIRSEARAVTAAPAGSWTLAEPAFSAQNGYPAEVAFYRDRLWFFATPGQPQTFWASKTSDYFNFALGSLDDDALQGTLNSDTVNAIRWALGLGRVLAIGTTGEEWVIDPGDQAALTPTTLADAVRPAGTAYGSTGLIRPLRTANVLLFLTKSRRKLREFVADPNSVFSVAYVAPDMTLLADHLTATIFVNGIATPRRIEEVAIQGEPQQTIWAVREDGTLLSLAYLRDQNVVGWARHIFSATPGPGLDPDGRRIPHPATGGFVESVCVIPHPAGDRDQVWVIVRRPTIHGQQRRYVEVLQDQGVNFADGLVVDAARVYDGQQYGVSLEMTSTEEGHTATFLASAPVFMPEHVGAEIRMMDTGARAVITLVESPGPRDTCLATITLPFGDRVAVAGSWGIAAYRYTGLAHLEGELVSPVGDGAVYPPMLVADSTGTIVVGYAAVKMEIGLFYPARLVTARPELSGLGTIQGVQKRHADAVVRLYRSLGVSLDGTLVPFRRGGDPLGTGVPLFTGDKPISHLGWDRDGRLTIEQQQALPCTILGLYALLATAD